MKRRKRIYILLAVLVVVCVATAAVTQLQERKEQIAATDEVILAVNPEDVTTLAWSYDDISLAFHKDGSWQWDEDAAFPVDEEEITKLLGCFESFGATFVIDDVEDYGQYGLDKPSCTISFSTETEDYEVKLGSYSQMDVQRYVSIGDGKVYLVSTDPFDTFGIELRNTIKNDETPQVDRVESIDFSGIEDYSISYDDAGTASYCPSDVYFTQQNGETVPLDPTAVDSYGDTLSNLSLNNYVSYNVTDEELAAWGLDSPELTITLQYAEAAENEDEDDGETDDNGDETEAETIKSFTLEVGRNQEELAAKEAAEAEIEAAETDEEREEKTEAADALTVTAYARVGDSPLVYQLTDSDYNALVAMCYNDLRHKDVVTVDFDQVSAIDITLDDTTGSITSALKEETDEDESDDTATDDTEDAEDGASRSFSYNGEEIELTDVIHNLQSLRITEFTDIDTTEKQELGLVFQLENDSFSQVTVQIYRHDGSSCGVVLNGASLGLVDRASVVDLIESLNKILLG